MLFTVVLLSGANLHSQGIPGQTEVRSFTRAQYGGGAQNWALLQDNNNRLYTANNEGLLVFDGTNWQLYPVPNKTILRCIGFGPGGKLFAGAQDEVGYYTSDRVGRLRFTSLKSLLPAAERNFPDVWELEVAGTDVFFRTNTRIFKLSGEKFNVYPAQSAWLSLHKHQGRALAHDRDNGLFLCQDNQWIPFIRRDSLPDGFFITDIVPYGKDTSLVCTISNGIYLLTRNQLIPFSIRSAGINPNQHFTSLAVLNDSGFLAGTYFNGIYRISRQGTVKENISAKNGLPNNTVRCLFTDNRGNAWAGLDNGLALFSYNNVIRQINPPAFNNGAGYDVKAFNGNLYFALSTGLYWLPAQPGADIGSAAGEPGSIMGGLTWNLSVINNRLLAGRDDGLYQVSNYGAVPVVKSPGYWTCRPVPGTSPQQMAAGNYLGIHFFEISPEAFADRGALENFTESSRYIETDKNSIWVSHPYRGIFRIDNSTRRVTLFTRKDGLPADLDNHVFKIKNKIVFATSAGIYEYDEGEKSFRKSADFVNLFGDLPIRYLKEDERGNIWFVQEKMVGVADYSGPKPVLHFIPELKNKILSGFESIFPLNTSNILVGGETGFYLLNYEKYRETARPFTSFITLVKTIGNSDSTFFGGYAFDSTGVTDPLTIPYKFNSLHFGYAATLFGLHSGVEFSYYLEGFDTRWSNWSSNTSKEYTNLPPGSYTFHIKARSSPSEESAAYRYPFTIKPPWYQTIWAYALYLALAAASIIAILKYQSARHRKKLLAKQQADQLKFEEEQMQMAYRHQLEMEKSEKQLIRLQNEKLEAEIAHKNAELAGTTMNLVQKKEFILKLKGELQQLQKAVKVGDDNPELKKVLKALSEEEKSGEEWEQFAQHFNRVHGDFLTTLKTKFPALRPHELRLCAYLRMNLSSKEIAPLMSISVRGVEISRYRLRKKMALPTEVNLVQFIMDLK